MNFDSFYEKQKVLQNCLLEEKLTKLFGFNCFVLFFIYFFKLIFARLQSVFFSNYQEVKLSDSDKLYFSWSSAHLNNFLINGVEDKCIIKIGRVLNDNILCSIFRNSSLLLFLVNFFRFGNFDSNLFYRFIIYTEFFSFYYFIKQTKCREVNVSGHFDRYVYSLAYACELLNVDFVIYQHGCLPKKINIPQIKVDKVILRFPVSIDYFSKYCLHTQYVLGVNGDFERIKNGVEYGDDFSILYIGQDSSPSLNHEILRVLIDCIATAGVNATILHAKHPRDDYDYKFSKYYKEISELPISPELVFSRYSTLAYSYTFFSSSVFFIDIDNIDVDFMDGHVNIIKINDISNVLLNRLQNV